MDRSPLLSPRDGSSVEEVKSIVIGAISQHPNYQSSASSPAYQRIVFDPAEFR